MKEYDVVVIGSGIAGMTSAMYLKRNNINVLIIENEAPGGQLNRSNIIENYPGFISIDGPSLAYNIYSQVTKLDIEYLFESITSIDYNNNIINIDSGNIKYKYLIFATGRSPRKLDVLEEYANKGVSYCAVCDGNLYKEKDVIVLGGGNSAFEEAIYLSKICKSIKLIHRNNNLKADISEIEKVKSLDNVEIILNTNIDSVNKIDNKFIINNKYKADGIFVCIGYVPNSNLFKGHKEDNYILVDKYYKTSINNVYAVGDIIKKDVYQLTTAASEATVAAIEIIKLLN